MLAALDRREISARELTEMHIARIERLNGPINAIINTTFDRARAAAANADARRARGERAPFLGLPITMKESNAIAGLPQTAGFLHLKDIPVAEDGPVGARALAAGAALLGQTNIPVALGDWQADSPVYGRTNNPWDQTRSPGGSTGGGSAALAAGLTPLEFGSDIGGSVRTPAAFCGVYGHRPSATLVPRNGSFPGGGLPNVTGVMALQGPLARSAYDLELALDVIAGPESLEDIAWRVEIPPARSDTLAGLRVAVLPPVPWITVDDELTARLDELATWLGTQGAKVASPALPFDMREHYLDYNRVLALQTSGPQPKDQRTASAEALRTREDEETNALADGLTMWAFEFAGIMGKREGYRQAYHRFFKDWDVLISPMALGPAFLHQQGPFEERTIQVNGKEVPYRDNLAYPSFAILAGQPATAFTGGVNRSGLPLGLQAIGPYLEDRTPLRFTQLVEDGWRKFEPPPGFD